MAGVIDYADVLQHATSLGMSCVYYNSGAFKLPADQPEHVVGWIGPTDATIRAGLNARQVQFDPPYERNLSAALDALWRDEISGPAWVMPKSHWAFELDHGNGGWMAAALEALLIDPKILRARTDASAIAFERRDIGLAGFIETLLTYLVSSDFAVVFPNHRHLVTIHHHKQLWWQTTEPDFAAKIADRDVNLPG